MIEGYVLRPITLFGKIYDPNGVDEKVLRFATEQNLMKSIQRDVLLAIKHKTDIDISEEEAEKIIKSLLKEGLIIKREDLVEFSAKRS